MKQFFAIVFGGLAVILAGIGISWAGSRTWQAFLAFAPAARQSLVIAANKVFNAEADGTSIAGLYRAIRYTADQEEDLVSNAGDTVPGSADGLVTAAAYVVMDTRDDRIVAGHNADQLLPIASLTKLVTAAVSAKLIDPSEHITITPDIINTFGNTAQFRAGETFRAEDLYYPLLMVSSNDAAEAFARHYGRKRFIQAMNDFAQSIGAYRTYFADPSGLSNDDESTATDMAIILAWLRLHQPDIIATTLLKSKTVKSHTWINPTHFLNWSNYSGGKNGYTPEANRTGAALFTLGPKKDLYAVVVLGSSYRDGDVIKLLQEVKK